MKCNITLPYLLIMISHRFVKTTANATVDHLSKYLALRIALEDRRTDGEAEDAGREEEAGEAGGTSRSGEGTSLSNISEKQYTIYITTRGGQFSVSHLTKRFCMKRKCFCMNLSFMKIIH